MTVQEFKDNVSADVLARVKEVCEKEKDVNEADAKALYDFFVEVAAAALGEDQVAEPFRYLASAPNGMRTSDLKAVIGDEFDEAAFDDLRTALGFELFVMRPITPQVSVLDFRFPPVKLMLQKLMGEGAYKACASDLGYHLMQHCEAGDPVRDVQTMHLLLDGDEAAAAAEYVSSVEGDALRVAVMTMGNALKDGPEYVQQCVFDMPLVQSEQVNLSKLLSLMLNDCMAIVGRLDRQHVVASRLHDIIHSLIAQGQSDVTVLLGIAKLRLAQNARSMAQQRHQEHQDEEAKKMEQEAQETFIEAMNYLMTPLHQADPTTISDLQLQQYWICLKICQEMAQPKAISLLFEAIVKVEQAQVAALAQKHLDENGQEKADDENVEVDEAHAQQITLDIINQHVDLAKLYYQFPKQIQEQFTNYTEGAISLLKTYLEAQKQQNADESALNDEELLRLCTFYQNLGELYQNLGKEEESYDAYTEAQIRQLRRLAALQKADEEAGVAMTPHSLIARLTLSVTNHNLGLYYRKQGKGQRDLAVLLRANMDMALDCFKAYPRDGRVVHFAINAALELGDLQHKTKGLKAECDTYTRLMGQFAVLNNMRLDQQLCFDIAMIHTKCGQCQADPSLRRYKDAVRNLENALNLWNMMAKNNPDPSLKKNAEIVATLLKQIKQQ